MKRRSLVPELTVSNFAESIDFYVNVIGFNIKYQRGNPRFAFLEFEDIQIMIEEYHEEGWNAGPLERPFGRGINFQISCSDVIQIIDRLHLNKFALYSPLQEVWYKSGNTKIGNKEFIVQDPDGYMLRFCEDLGERKLV